MGKGQFGTVFKGFFKENHAKLVAVKVIPLESISKDPKFVRFLKREIEILQKIKSPYIVDMYHATRTPHNLYMFLEYCGDGDLRELIKKRGGRLTESEAVMYFRQICQGFKDLYKNNIIHRDIKPANILLKDGIAKISDFGFARCIDQMNTSNMFTFLGTPLYMSPQILMEEKFSCKCDIWSLGMVFYECLFGKTPWTGKTPYELYKNIKNNKLEFPESVHCSKLVKDLLQLMLVLDDGKRVTWDEIFEHQLIKFDENEIQKVLSQISSQNDKDNLLKSVELNDYYLKNNKVFGADKAKVKAFANQKQEKIIEEDPNQVSQAQTEKSPTKPQALQPNSSEESK